MTKHTYNHKVKKGIHITKRKRFRYKFSKKICKKNNSIKRISTNDTHNHNNIINNEQLIKKNLNKYSYESKNNHLETYGKNILLKNLNKELKENRKIITEEILCKYNLKQEHRKFAFINLLDIIKEPHMNIKCFFSSLYIFDLFLINYSEDNLNLNKCQNFFKSKITNQFSKVKLNILILCCHIISSNYFETKGINIKQLLQYENARYEYTYKDLLNLIEDIIKYTDANICDLNIYLFIQLYLYDIKNSLKEFKNEKFFKYFEEWAIRYSFMIINDNISMLKIFDSIKAFGIILFTYEESKFIFKLNNQKLDFYFNQWKKKLKELLTNFDGLKKIFDFLNECNSRMNLN